MSGYPQRPGRLSDGVPSARDADEKVYAIRVVDARPSPMHPHPRTIRVVAAASTRPVAFRYAVISSELDWGPQPPNLRTQCLAHHWSRCLGSPLSMNQHWCPGECLWHRRPLW